MVSIYREPSCFQRILNPQAHQRTCSQWTSQGQKEFLPRESFEHFSISHIRPKTILNDCESFG